MTSKENKVKIYLPLVFAVVMIAGIFLGYWLTPRNIFPDGFNPIKKTRADKVNDVINYVTFEYVDSVNRDKLLEDAIGGVLKHLDPHSQYITAEEFSDLNDPLVGNFKGIGVEFRIIDDTVTVIWCIEGGPSEKAGLRPGDRIVTVDDSSFAGRGITNQEVMRTLKGPGGSKVKIEVYRRGSPVLISFTLQRDVIPTSGIDAYFLPAKGTGYMKLSRFAANTYDEFTAAIDYLLSAGTRNLILDLRGNTGGYLQSAIKIADEFLKKDLMIVYTEGFNRPRTEYHASSRGRCEDIALAVLIDGHSASASEIIAGAIQDNDRGIIIGRRSYGKGLVQEQIDFSDGSALRLTVARYFTPTGRCIQKPYSSMEDDGFDNYHNEYYLRYMNGELENADSVPIIDSLKYITPEGKIVYGGGGIMPDIFIPAESDPGLAYYNRLLENDLFLKFVFDYENSYLSALHYSSAGDFLDGFRVNKEMMDTFIQYCERKGVIYNSAGFEFAEEKIYILLGAYFARIKFGDAGFFPMYLNSDKIYLRALKYFSEYSDHET
ncbi:MAG: S41 family peptidase [Bacteroidales bacterium]|nr:S41 family peptidase [Bacteroidales bacterium]